MAKRAAAKRPSVDEYLELFAASAPQPPSGALINAVLEHADIRQEIGDGRVVLRLSERRANRRDVRRGLGRQGARLSQVSLIWDEDDGQILQVCDGSEAADAGAWNQPSELDRFELTEAALAYVAQFESDQRA
jgi:hypothetical protein